MTRSVFPFYSPDISALARSLHGQLATCSQTPGHLELLNMLSRAAGCRNFQQFRAQAAAQKQLLKTASSESPVDYDELKRLVRYFNASGHLVRWPTKFSHQEPCLWVLWSRLPPRTILSEPEINELLLANHLFEDPALLRREMKERKMVTRTLDGREYQRVERRPPPSALTLIRFLGERTQRGQT
jgi:hypothetical protein